MDEIADVRQVQRDRVEDEENRILKQIFDAQSNPAVFCCICVCSLFAGKCGLTFLGRDRAFRSYYYSENVPAVFVASPVVADEIGDCSDDATSLDKVK